LCEGLLPYGDILRAPFFQITDLTGEDVWRSGIGSFWRHALGDITPVAALAFQSGGAAFTLAGSPIARDALVAEAGSTSLLPPTPRSVFPGPASSRIRATTMPSRVILAGDSDFTLGFDAGP
jgi:hypothetical protein